MPLSPIYVDLDGTLSKTDTLEESVLILLRKNPLNLFRLFFWLCFGRLAFKKKLAEYAPIDASKLSFNQPFLDFLKEQKNQGCPLILASAADDRLVQAVAAQVGIFSDAFGSKETNLKSTAKLLAIREHAKNNRYATWRYAGNSKADKAIWMSECEQAIVVHAPPKLAAEVCAQKVVAPIVFAAPERSSKTWLKAIRITQWAKNILLFVPLLAAHSSDSAAWWAVCLAFLSFGLCASATYLLNDLLDLNHDRLHKTKCNRPLAAAQISIMQAMGVALLFFVLAFGLACYLSVAFFIVLGVYTGLTVSYSFVLKKVAPVDVITLSILYAIRIVAGAIVTHVALSNWLLAISIFLFLSLALSKRCAELEDHVAEGADKLAQPPGRGYVAGDLPSLRVMGISSGFLSVVVFTLYVDSQNSQVLYAHPEFLWAMAPVLLLWMMRLWLKTGRRELEGEDPLLFALKDPYSWLTAGMTAILAFFASHA